MIADRRIRATDSPLQLYLRSALIVLAAACGLALLGIWPTLRLAGTDGVIGMSIGIAIALLAGMIGLGPAAAFSNRDLRHYSNGVLLGMALRLMVTLAAALLARLALPELRVPLLAWVGIAYIVLLAVEGMLLLNLKNRIAGAAA